MRILIQILRFPLSFLPGGHTAALLNLAIRNAYTSTRSGWWWSYSYSYSFNARAIHGSKPESPVTPVAPDILSFKLEDLAVASCTRLSSRTRERGRETDAQRGVCARAYPRYVCAGIKVLRWMHC